MDDAVFVKVLESTEYLAANERYLLFGEFNVPNLRNVRNGTSSAVVLSNLWGQRQAMGVAEKRPCF